LLSANKASIFEAMPAEAGEPQAMSAPLALETLLPQTRAYYTYNGSLTTPPCSEIVRWLLLDTPVELSTGQIAAFNAIYAGNARPVQSLGKRDLLHDAR
jgi:carbonic anhydrase